MRDHKEFMKAHRALLGVLRKAQDARSLRQGTCDTGEFGWVVWERYAMWGEVNRWRGMTGSEAVPLSRVVSKENLAKGHFDYTHKFALYCAELVFEGAETRE